MRCHNEKRNAVSHSVAPPTVIIQIVAMREKIEIFSRKLETRLQPAAAVDTAGEVERAPDLERKVVSGSHRPAAHVELRASNFINNESAAWPCRGCRGHGRGLPAKASRHAGVEQGAGRVHCSGRRQRQHQPAATSGGGRPSLTSLIRSTWSVLLTRPLPRSVQLGAARCPRVASRRRAVPRCRGTGAHTCPEFTSLFKRKAFVRRVRRGASASHAPPPGLSGGRKRGNDRQRPV